MYRYKLNGPVFSQAAVSDAAWFLKEPGAFGTAVSRFEERFNKHFGLDWSVAVSNATAAYHMIIAYLGLSHGDKIIVPAYTFVSAANVPLLAGMETLFCDCAGDTPVLSLEHMRRLADSGAKALLFVSTLGYCSGIREAWDFCRERGIVFIHDAASSLGTRIQGEDISSMGDFVFTSLHYKKILSSFEGGLLWGNRGKDFFTSYRNHGYLDGYNAPGLNFRMSDLHAVIGLRQLETLDARMMQRQKLYETYVSALEGCPGISVTAYPETVRPAYHQMVATSGRRDELARYLEERGIETGRPAQFIPSLPAYAHVSAGDLPNASRFASDAISLPFHENLTADDVQAVCEAVREFPW